MRPRTRVFKYELFARNRFFWRMYRCALKVLSNKTLRGSQAVLFVSAWTPSDVHFAAFLTNNQAGVCTLEAPLATTKQAEREQTDALLADEYLADLVYDALLERGEASKVSEITLEINNPRITFPVVRRILNESPRFITIDRLWNLSARFSDQERPTERTMLDVLLAAGKPLGRIQIATELSEIYHRDASIYLSTIPNLLKSERNYFKTTSGEYGPAAWVPLVDGEDEADILQDNKIGRAQLAPYQELTKNVVWTTDDYAGATFKAVDALRGRPVAHRVLGVLAYLALREKYDARKHLVACFADPSLVWISGKSGGRWITRARANKLEAILEARGAALASDADVDPEPTPVAVPVAAPTADAVTLDTVPVDATATPLTPEPVAAPLDVTESDLRALERIIADRGGAVDAAELLALQYEVVAGDPSFRSDVETLTARLRSDDRFLSVGAGRFREPNSLPLFVYSIPEFHAFPEFQFISMDGEIMDEEIEDEGYVGTLRQDVGSPLAQDAGDDDGRYTGPAEARADDGSIRLVVKAHHKEIGTFPLCQIPDDFFPSDAPVIEIVVRDPDGNAHDVIVNRDIRLAFNLFGLYELLDAESGATFRLYPAARPYEFRFEPLGETDGQIYVAPARIAELLALREQAETGGDMATFDLACEILAYNVKGLDFVQTLTEVNIVRRVTRRKLASILSNYYCFVQKAGQPLWRFDARKKDLGTDSAKRKYLKR